jgi:peptide/nickel transport system substrate-binding protein
VTPSAARRSRTALLSAVLLLAALLAAALWPPGIARAASPTASTSASGKKVLTIAVAQTVDSLSPFLAQTVVATGVHRMMYEYLTNYSAKDASAIPGLASSWKTSPDELTWTYTIRSGEKWSDGTPVTAHDAAFTFSKMISDPAAATANGNFTGNFASATAPDDRTLVITLKKPQATMLALDVPIVPEHVWKKVKDYSTFNNDQSFPVVSDGPFTLTRYQPDQYIQLDANKHYWRGAPKFDQVLFKYYKDQDAAVEALRKGEVSFVSGLTPAQFESLKHAPGVTTNLAAAKRFFALAMNPGASALNGRHFGDGNAALRDLKVRQAIEYAIDRNALVKKATQGYAKPGAGYIPPRYGTYHWSPDAATAMNYDPSKANALLDAAGYKRGPDGVRRSPQGKPLTLRLLGHNTDPQDQRAGNYVAGWLNAVGIKLNQSYVDPSALASQEQAGNFDLAIDGWTVNPDPDYVLSIQTCGARPPDAKSVGATDDFICDPAYDKLYAQQSQEYDKAKRASMVKQMQQRMYSDAYLDVLYYPAVMEAYRGDRISSMERQPLTGGNLYQQDGYWSWWSAVPASASADASAGGGGLGTGGIVGIVVAAVVVIGGVSVFAVRRRRTADERE